MADNQSPKDKKNRHKNLRNILYAIIGAAIITLIFLVSRTTIPKPSATATPSATSIDLTALKNEQVAVLGKSKIIFPEIISRADIKQSQIPKNIGLIFVSNPDNGLFQKLTFKDGRRGYYASFSVPNSLTESMGQYTPAILSQNNWTRLYQTRAALFGVIEMSNPAYSAQIKFSKINDQKTSVTITVITNKK